MRAILRWQKFQELSEVECHGNSVKNKYSIAIMSIILHHETIHDLPTEIVDCYCLKGDILEYMCKSLENRDLFGDERIHEGGNLLQFKI